MRNDTVNINKCSKCSIEGSDDNECRLLKLALLFIASSISLSCISPADIFMATPNKTSAFNIF